MATAKADARKTSNNTVKVDAVGTTRKGSVVDADVEINLSAVQRPLYAYVGAADFAVEKLRELPTVYVQRVQQVQIQAQKQAKALPDKARALYTDFVVRGQKLVVTLRNNPEAEQAVNEAKNAVQQVKGATTSAKKAAKSGEAAAERTADKVEVETR